MNWINLTKLIKNEIFTCCQYRIDNNGQLSEKYLLKLSSPAATDLYQYWNGAAKYLAQSTVWRATYRSRTTTTWMNHKLHHQPYALDGKIIRFVSSLIKLENVAVTLEAAIWSPQNALTHWVRGGAVTRAYYRTSAI